MFELPSTVTEPKDLADWVELCVLAGDTPSISRTEIEDHLQDSGLFENLSSGQADGDPAADDDAQRSAGLIWQELQRRATVLSSAARLRVDGTSVERICSSWEECSAYVSLLLSQLSTLYTMISLRGYEKLFEKVTQASLKGLLGGESIRFGTPFDSGWPSGIDERIRHLADLYAVSPRPHEAITQPHDQDLGLDVVANLGLGGFEAGGLLLLTQCATGKEWTEKKGEPSLTQWHDVIDWGSILVRALAVPWRLPRSPRWTFAHFDSIVILDQPRLLLGNPDLSFDPAYLQELRQWCTQNIALVPRV